MKPLELTVYEKEPGRYGREATYNSPDGLWAYPASHADGYSIDKRLTDAELAAEWQQEQRHMAVAVICGQPDALTKARRTDALLRFAALPHYDQEEAQA